MKQVNKTLEKFGLSENEIKIYLACLKKDETSPYVLSKLTKIPRTTVYDVVMNLSLKGLVTIKQSTGLEKQQTKIIAKSPNEIRDIIRGRHKELYELELDVIDALPKLNKDFLGEEANADFQFLPGIEGAKKAYFGESYIDIDLERFVITDMTTMNFFGREEINNDIDNVTNIAKNHKQIVKEVIPLNEWSKHVLTYQYGRNPDYIRTREFRGVETPGFNLYQRITIIGSRVLISCVVKSETWGMIINSKAFSESMLSIFNTLWGNAKKITPNLIESWGANELLNVEREKSGEVIPSSEPVIKIEEGKVVK